MPCRKLDLKVSESTWGHEVNCLGVSKRVSRRWDLKPSESGWRGEVIQGLSLGVVKIGYLVYVL